MKYASVQSPVGIESMGHKYCGGCCDMRRAVIICDVTLLVRGTLFLFAEGFGVYRASTVANMSFDDDAFASFGYDSTAEDFQEGLEGQQVQALMKQAEDLFLGLMVIASITLATTGTSIQLLARGCKHYLLGHLCDPSILHGSSQHYGCYYHRSLDFCTYCLLC